MEVDGTEITDQLRIDAVPVGRESAIENIGYQGNFFRLVAATHFSEK